MNMNLVKRKKYPVFGDMMHSFFNDDFFHPITSHTADHFQTPSVNIREDEKHYSIEAVLSGMKKEDIELSVDNNVLKMVAENKREVKEEEENYTRREFKVMKYARSFRLPEGVDASKIKADYTDGILSVTIPKTTKKEQKTKSIEIS